MQVYGAPASPDARGTRAGLVLLYAPSFEQFAPAYLLHERDLVIGRDPSCGICVPEAAVSRQHARVHYQGGRWVLTDLGGRNGTLVDGEFVDEIALEHLHEIRVGDAIFKFVESGAESYARHRIDGAIVGGPEERGAAQRPRSRVIGGYQIDRLLRALDRVAQSPISVVLLGESGTGKEVFAEHLHAASGRRGAFQAVNCAAIPAPLLESELFGYRRGAFSGADRDKIGLVRAADGGTLLLDEIGDMPLEAQTKLLRVLQSKEVIPIGATQPERVDVRVVCATHRDLGKLQREGRFRGDLFARLNEYSLTLPPLRERKEDVFALCRALLARHGRPDLGVTFPFMTGLLHHDFPFNVRELEAIIKRGIALAEGPALDAHHLPDDIRDRMKSYGSAGSAGSAGPTADEGAAPPTRPSGGATPERVVATAHEGAAPPTRPSGGAAPERVVGRSRVPTEEELRALLRHHKGNVAAVGREFGKERMQVHRWMKRYNIDVNDYR
ncbi:MAG: sigma 54-interacting transcriptional regulator [Polyangiaceae bacterium]|nr:sigma 54-interacting transcriptional regulator [Polyangiaceae bacterium]